MIVLFHSLEAKTYLAEIEDGMEEDHDYKRAMNVFRSDYPIPVSTKMKHQMTRGKGQN